MVVNLPTGDVSLSRRQQQVNNQFDLERRYKHLNKMGIEIIVFSPL
jgi:hypothetical protein